MGVKPTAQAEGEKRLPPAGATGKPASQPPCPPVFHVLRRAHKHLDQIIVQAVIKLALEGPLKLRMVEIPRMQIEIIRVHRHRGILEVNHDLYSLALGMGGKGQQRMFVQAQLRLYPVEAGVRSVRHARIVKHGDSPSPRKTPSLRPLLQLAQLLAASSVYLKGFELRASDWTCGRE